MGKNFLDRLAGSIGWLLIGVLVFLGSFVVLYKTEGMVDLSKVANKAAAIEKIGDNQDAFVYATGVLKTPDYLSDEIYIQGNYIVLDRKVEMYAWFEEAHSEDDDTYYTYSMKWVDDVPDSTKFNERRRHENPSKPQYSKTYTVNKASVGDYDVNMDKVRLPGLKALSLKDETIDPRGGAQVVSDKEHDYIFEGYGTFENPEVGDIRYSYSVLPSGEKVTVFGKVDGTAIERHSGEQNGKIYRIFKGSKADALDVLKGEYKTAGWAGKIASFFLMWIGLMLILKPLTVSLEIIPIIGKLGKSALGVITFTLALILTVVSSVVFSIIQSVVGLVVIAVVVVGAGIYVNTTKNIAKSK